MVTFTLTFFLLRNHMFFFFSESPDYSHFIGSLRACQVDCIHWIHVNCIIFCRKQICKLLLKSIPSFSPLFIPSGISADEEDVVILPASV